MLNTQMILAMVAWPAVATAAALAVLRIPAVQRWRGSPLVAPAAVAVGFLVGYWGIVGRPEVPPPLDAKAALPLVALIALGVAVVATRWRDRTMVWWAAAALLSAGSVWLVLRAAIAFQWSAGAAAARVGVLAAGMMALLWSARALHQRAAHRTFAMALAAVAGLGAPVMLFSDSMLMAQLHGGLGVSAAVVLAAVWFAPSRVPVSGVAPVVVAVAWSLWVIALLFANMPVLSFVLLASALPAAIAATHVVRTRPARWRLVATVATVLALVGGSVATGGAHYMRGAATDATGAQDGDYGYGYNQ